MPRHPAQRIVRQETAQKYDYTVKTVRALPKDKFTDMGSFNCASIQDAQQVADRMQREFDVDCDPCRTYVYNGVNPAPVYAGLQMKEYGGYRGW